MGSCLVAAPVAGIFCIFQADYGWSTEKVELERLKMRNGISARFFLVAIPTVTQTTESAAGQSENRNEVSPECRAWPANYPPTGEREGSWLLSNWPCAGRAMFAQSPRWLVLRASSEYGPITARKLGVPSNHGAEARSPVQSRYGSSECRPISPGGGRSRSPERLARGAHNGFTWRRLHWCRQVAPPARAEDEGWRPGRAWSAA